MHLIDSTLREGAQVPGACFTPRRRAAILRGLAAAGVTEAEIAVAARDVDLKGLVRAARRAAPTLRLAIWCRALPGDVALASAAGADAVAMSMPASDLHLTKRLGRDRAWALEQIPRLADLARRSGARYLALGLEDATRADADHLRDLFHRARESGFDRIRLADTVGVASPVTMARLVRYARSGFRGAVAVHCHDDFAMATANAVAAGEAGAAWADGTLLGIGERAGNARTEVLLAWLHQHGGHQDLSGLPALCRRAARACGRSVPRHAPVVGPDIWRSVAGLHVDGLAKDQRTYQPYDPALVGARHQPLLGPQSGLSALRRACADQGLEPDAEALAQALRHLRSAGRLVETDEVAALVRGSASR